MNHVPINRWTVGLALVLAAVFGGDFVSAVARAVMALSGPYLPAV